MKTECQISFRATNEFKERLEKAAEKERRPVAGLIKVILEDWLKEYEEKEERK